MFIAAAKVKYNFSDDENSNPGFNSDDDDQVKPIQTENFNHASEVDEDSQGPAALSDDDDADFGFGNSKPAETIPKKTIPKPL